MAKKNKSFLNKKKNTKIEAVREDKIDDSLEKVVIDLIDLEKTKSKDTEKFAINRFYGDRLSLLLNYYGMSQAVLARRIKVPYMYISLWCIGDEIPKSEDIEKLCFIFEVKYNFFTDDFIQLDIFNGVIQQRDWKKDNNSKNIKTIKDVIPDDVENNFEYLSNSILNFLKLKENKNKDKEKYIIMGTSDNVCISTVNKISKIPEK